jgi:SH3-like domain-containing protein
MVGRRNFPEGWRVLPASSPRKRTLCLTDSGAMAKRGAAAVTPRTRLGAKTSVVVVCSGKSGPVQAMHSDVHPRRLSIAPHHRLAAVCLAGLLSAAGAGVAAHAQSSEGTTVPKAAASAPEVLRYSSLKSDRVLARKGPGGQHPIAWVFKRAGLPVAVLRESEAWHEVRDAGGTVGWVHGSLLSSRRTALILPWEVGEGRAPPVATLRDGGHDGARPVAQIEAGALVGIIECVRRWCRVSIGDHRGWIEQVSLWGTYPGEDIR